MGHCAQERQCPSVCRCGDEVRGEEDRVPVVIHWNQNPGCRYGSVMQRATWADYTSTVTCPSCREKMP